MSTEIESGMYFGQAIQACHPTTQKIIYGTRSEKWHLIEDGDRDWNTPFALPLGKAMMMGEDASLIKSTTGA